MLGDLLGPQFLSVANTKGDTPAHFAVSFPNNHNGAALLQVLHDVGGIGTLEVADLRGYTPVHRAAQHGLVESVILLHHLGCDVGSLQLTGESAAHGACLNGQARTLGVLVELAGASIASVRETLGGLTPAHAAGQSGSVECLQVIADKVGERQLRVKDNFGRTVAHHAAGYGRLDVLRMLDQRGFGATLWMEDNQGDTPLSLANTHGHAEVADWLQQHKPVSKKSCCDAQRLNIPGRHGGRSHEKNVANWAAEYKLRNKAWGGDDRDEPVGKGPNGFEQRMQSRDHRAAKSGKPCVAEGRELQTSEEQQLARFEAMLAEELRVAQPAPLTRRQKKDLVCTIISILN